MQISRSRVSISVYGPEWAKDNTMCARTDHRPGEVVQSIVQEYQLLWTFLCLTLRLEDTKAASKRSKMEWDR